jgi:hypothetical protein
MPRRNTSSASSGAGRDGIIAGGGLFAGQPIGVTPTGMPDPYKSMEEQW